MVDFPRHDRSAPPLRADRSAVEGHPLTVVPESPVELLRSHAAAGPHRPWLFAAHGWDWRWIAWGEAEARVAAAAAELRTRVEQLTAHTSGTPWLASPWLTYPSEPRPAAVLLDLAIQAAGAVPVPVQRHRWDANSELPEGMDARVETPPVLGPEHPAPRKTVWPEGLPVEPPPDVAVRDPDGSLREISSEELSAAARELADRIDEAGSSGEERRAHDTRIRDIVVSARSLDDPEERRLLAWALRLGAAVVLEPRLESHVATARWVRPTVFAGDAEEVEALVRAAEAYRSPPLRRLGRWLRRRLGGEPREPLPFDRLCTVLLRSSESDRGLPETLGEAWKRRGVHILRI